MREQINEMPPMEYIAAQKFLDGLVGELRFQVTKFDQVTDSQSNRKDSPEQD